MNIYNVDDKEFINSDLYKEFITQNSENGYLRIRAYSASQAIPVRGLKIVVSKMIDNSIVIFYEGYTDESGVIEKISLPAPKLGINDLNVPNFTTYDITATIKDSNRVYKVNLYENVYVIQNINISPDTKEIGDLFGN